MKIKVTALGLSEVSGKIVVKVGGKKYKATLKDGKAFVRLDRFANTGKKSVKVKYAGNRKVAGHHGVHQDQGASRLTPLTPPSLAALVLLSAGRGPLARARGG